ncbi:hypothetical protein AGR1C_pAt30090 [Agrobacterium fabacearum TT111]|nr:hypothetical protein AGR1C_pAt30090 [Agrobacterium fabacearum TT111]
MSFLVRLISPVMMQFLGYEKVQPVGVRRVHDKVSVEILSAVHQAGPRSPRAHFSSSTLCELSLLVRHRPAEMELLGQPARPPQ